MNYSYPESDMPFYDAVGLASSERKLLPRRETRTLSDSDSAAIFQQRQMKNKHATLDFTSLPVHIWYTDSHLRYVRNSLRGMVFLPVNPPKFRTQLLRRFSTGGTNTDFRDSYSRRVEIEVLKQLVEKLERNSLYPCNKSRRRPCWHAVDPEKADAFEDVMVLGQPIQMTSIMSAVSCWKNGWHVCLPYETLMFWQVVREFEHRKFWDKCVGAIPPSYSSGRYELGLS